MLFNNPFHQCQCLLPVKSLVALHRFIFKCIKRIHIETSRRSRQHPEEIGAHFAKKLSGECGHFSKPSVLDWTKTVQPSKCGEHSSEFHLSHDYFFIGKNNLWIVGEFSTS